MAYDTHQEIYDKYERRINRLIAERETQALALAFPETQGNRTYVHNWIVCGNTAKGREPGQSELAQSIQNEYCERRARINARYKRLYAAALHRDHVNEGRAGAYLWCKACKAVASPQKLQTIEYRRLYNPEIEREHGPYGFLETYYHNDSSINLTTDEREGFERDTGVFFYSDTIPEHSLTRLVQWLKTEELLAEVTL